MSSFFPKNKSKRRKYKKHKNKDKDKSKDRGDLKSIHSTPQFNVPLPDVRVLTPTRKVITTANSARIIRKHKNSLKDSNPSFWGSLSSPPTSTEDDERRDSKSDVPHSGTVFQKPSSDDWDTVSSFSGFLHPTLPEKEAESLKDSNKIVQKHLRRFDSSDDILLLQGDQHLSNLGTWNIHIHDNEYIEIALWKIKQTNITKLHIRFLTMYEYVSTERVHPDYLLIKTKRRFSLS
jgi:hypothetical protein